jgi:hypothetical protein
MPNVRLQAIESQDDSALGLRYPLEAGGVGQRESQQFIVTFEQIGHRTRSNDYPPMAQVLMDVRQAVVLCVAQRPHPGDDIQAKLVLRQGEPSFFFGAVGAAELGTGAVETAPNLECEMQNLRQGGNGTIVMIRHHTPFFS